MSRSYRLSWGVLTVPSSESQADPGYRSVSSFDEDIRCRPGVEGRYLAEAHHLSAQLHEDPSA